MSQPRWIGLRLDPVRPFFTRKVKIMKSHIETSVIAALSEVHDSYSIDGYIVDKIILTTTTEGADPPYHCCTVMGRPLTNKGYANKNCKTAVLYNIDRLQKYAAVGRATASSQDPHYIAHHEYWCGEFNRLQQRAAETLNQAY